MSKVQVDKVVNLSDDGAPQLTYGAELPVGYGLTGAGGLNISGVVTAASAVFSGNVTIGGTLTYEDVTNIDVVGVSTFAGRMNVNSTINANEGINVSAGVITAPSGFSGDLLIEDKIVHTGDTNTALRFPSADTITAETGGSERVRITSDGNLGVGDNSPDVRLHVTETVDVAYTVDTVTSEANNLVKLENPSTTANAFSGMQFRVGSGADMFVGAIQQSANAGDLYVVNQNAPNKELLRIKSTSKVGLGTNNPQLNLHIHSESSNASFTHFTNTTTGVSASDGVSIGLDSDENAVIYNYESTAIRFATAGSERLRISSSGFVGVGTANPVRKLHVADDNSEIMLVQSGNASGSYINYKLGANGAELGMLGSGAAILSGGADAADFGIRSSGDLCFSSGGHAERARFDTSGNFLIGTQSATSELTVRGGGTVAAFEGTGGNTAIMFVDVDNSKNLFVQNANGEFNVQTGGNSYATKLAVTEAGLVKIGLPAAVTQSRNLNIGSDSEANLAIETHNDSTSETANIRFYKSGNTGASPQILEANDNIAQIMVYGHDGTDYANQAAGIKFNVDGTPGSNDMPGEIQLLTNNGTGGVGNRFNISATGNIGWMGDATSSSAIQQRKRFSTVSHSANTTYDVNICEDFGNNDVIKLEYAFCWNDGDGGAWGTAIAWKHHDGNTEVRYLGEEVASPVSSFVLAFDGNTVKARIAYGGSGMNGYRILNVECGGQCSPAEF
jgi:hypothetical protein